MAKYIVHHGIRIAQDFVPETFGRLTTIGPEFRIRGETKQVFACTCGQHKAIRRQCVVSGNTSSCGCLDIEKRIERNTKHGMFGTPTHRVWLGMLSRCKNCNVKSYKDYGGRGIRVCDRWREPDGQGFLNFLADVGEKPGPCYEINRKENDGNYETGNCHWATRKEQANNRRTSRWIEHNGEILTLAQWSEKAGILPDTLAARIKRA